MIFYSVTEKATGERLTVINRKDALNDHLRNDRDWFTLEEALQKTQHNFERFSIEPYHLQIPRDSFSHLATMIDLYIDSQPDPRHAKMGALEMVVREQLAVVLRGLSDFIRTQDRVDAEGVDMTNKLGDHMRDTKKRRQQ